jgi:hypothetical protein
MAEPADKPGYTFAEYVALEEQSEERHALIGGEMLRIPERTPEYARLGAHMAWALVDALRHRRCEVFGSRVRVRVQATGFVTYPCVFAVRDRLEVDPEDRNTVIHGRSDSTAHVVDLS